MKHLLLLGLCLVALHLSHSAVPEFCNLKYDEGSGTKFLAFLFYNSTTGQCNPFIYKGEGGNANRFRSDKDCIKNCSARAEEIYPTDASKACLYKKASGDCSVKIPSFYYDPIHDKCKMFTWTGCHGNGNRFPTFALCNSTCAGIHVDGDEAEELDSDTPVALICGIVLAIIIAAVLITVIVLSVKSKKKNSKKKGKAKAKEPQVESPLQEQATEMA
ncbi:BPTI/Kunitz domain-containing protein [Betta splendens]|uniref:BPTI/Kunitz domain-containing protein n=1 Tax=Betta splendens TaxID=158456 RepID=A0A6P7MVX8_BETSP|nr:BPTI/Kunitz domain-containing protein [Betta splendens]